MWKFTWSFFNTWYHGDYLHKLGPDFQPRSIKKQPTSWTANMTPAALYGLEGLEAKKLVRLDPQSPQPPSRSL